MPYSQENKTAALAFIAAKRKTVHCRECGGQPVDWHNPKHVEDPNMRVAGLAALGYPIEDIKAEMAKCVPLCRSCHVTADNKLKAKKVQKEFWAGTPFADL